MKLRKSEIMTLCEEAYKTGRAHQRLQRDRGKEFKDTECFIAINEIDSVQRLIQRIKDKNEEKHAERRFNMTADERIEDIKKNLHLTPQERIEHIEYIKTLIQIGLDQLEGNPEYERDPEVCDSGYVHLKILDEKIDYWEKVENQLENGE